MKRIKIALTLSLLALAASCKKDGTSPDGSDIIPSTKPQVDIPWPGLANTSWPMFLHDPQHTGRSEYRGPQQGAVEWFFEAGGFVFSSPIVGLDGSLYFAAKDGLFYAVTSMGAMKWTFAMGGPSESCPTISSDGTLYVGSATDTYYALDEVGRPKWQYRLGGGTTMNGAVPSYDGKMVYLIAYDSSHTGGLYAFTREGTLRWRFAPAGRDLVGYPPALSMAGVIYCSSYSPSGQAGLYAVDTSGALRWRFPVSGNNVTTQCIDNDGNIYFAGGSTLYSVDPQGNVRWQTSGLEWIYDRAGPVIGKDGAIYIAGRYVYAFDYAGKLKWKYSLDPGLTQSSPALDANGTIYLGRATRSYGIDSTAVLALNPDGTLKFALALRGADGILADIDSQPVISSDGKIYVGSDYPGSHRLFKIH